MVKFPSLALRAVACPLQWKGSIVTTNRWMIFWGLGFVIAGLVAVFQIGPFDAETYQSGSRRGDLLEDIYAFWLPRVGAQATAIIVGTPAILIGGAITGLAIRRERQAMQRRGEPQGEKPSGDEVDGGGDPTDFL